MIFLTISFTAVLIASPQADLQKTASYSAAEKSTEIADAGVRDSLVWLNTYQSRLSNWLPDPDTVSGTSRGSSPAYRVLVSKTASGTTLSTMTASTSFSPTLPTSRKWEVVTYSSSFYRDGFPIFESGNFVSFGGGQYAFLIRPLGNGHYQVEAEGRSTGASFGSATARSSVVRIRAVVTKPVNTSDTPAATTFANPNNGDWVDSSTGATVDPVDYYFTQTGGGGPSTSTVSGQDIDGVQNTAGAAYQNTTFNNLNTNTVTGTPNTTSTTGTNPMFNNVDKIVTLVEQTSATSTLKKYYWGATAPSGYTGATTSTLSGGSLVLNSPSILYIKIPANTTVSASTGLFTLNGAAQLQGLVIIDVGDNVTFTENPVYNKNGNGGADQPMNGGVKGAFIFYQRGTIRIPSSGFYLFEKQGNSGYHFAWSSTFYAQALANLPLTLKISSYVILDSVR